MMYRQIIYGGSPITSQPEADVIRKMQRYYKNRGKDDHLVAYFNYYPNNLKELFPLCAIETYESIFYRFRNYKPPEGRKCDIVDDKESNIFPKFSIVDCETMPTLRGHRKVYNMFVDEAAHRFIVFVNFQKKNAFVYCGGSDHVLYSSKGTP
jgi:hypothetical protein